MSEVCGPCKQPIGFCVFEKERTTNQVTPVLFGIAVTVAGGVRPFVVAQISADLKPRPRISRADPIARN